MSNKISWLPTVRMLWETCPHTVQDKLLEEKKAKRKCRNTENLTPTQLKDFIGGMPSMQFRINYGSLCIFREGEFVTISLNRLYNTVSD